MIPDNFPILFVASLKNMSIKSYLVQYQCHRPGPLAPSPAVDERLVVARLVNEVVEDVLADVPTDQSSTKLPGSHPVSGIQGSNCHSLLIAQYWQVYGPNYPVFCKF